MRKLHIFLVTLGVVGLVAYGASEAKDNSAKGMKVATVDFQRAINETNAGKKAEKELNSALEERKKKFDILKKELDTMRKDFEKQRLVLSGKPLDEKRTALQNKLIEVERTGVTYEQDLTKKKAVSLKSIVTGLQKVVEAIGVKEQYDFIFERTQGGVLFSSGAEDITDQVIKEFNKNHK